MTDAPRFLAENPTPRPVSISALVHVRPPVDPEAIHHVADRVTGYIRSLRIGEPVRHVDVIHALMGGFVDAVSVDVEGEDENGELRCGPDEKTVLTGLNVTLVPR